MTRAVVARLGLPLLLLGVLLGGGRPVWAEEPLFAFAQISDSQPETPEHWARFQQVLDTLGAAGSPGALLPRPVDFVLFAGDLVSNAEDPVEWAAFLATVEASLTAHAIPYRSVPGNHDQEEVGIVNYELFIGDPGVWDSDSAYVLGQNGHAVYTGWSGLRIIGFNNSNGAWNQIGAGDLDAISARVAAAEAAGENVYLLGHHPHDELGRIPLAGVLENPAVCCYGRGHSGSPGARHGLDLVANPGVWDLDSNSSFEDGAILYIEAHPSELRVYVIELDASPAVLPAPRVIALARPLVPASLGPPTAEFSAAPASGTAPLAVSFADLSSGSPTAWSWSFGDGATSTQPNPSHTYAAPGIYDVTLTVANAAGSSAKTRAGLVAALQPPPTQTFLPGADARVRSSSPDGNDGTDPELRVRAGDPTHRSYLRFDVTGVLGAPVDSATLRLFANDGSPDGGALYPVSVDWSEGGISWANAPPIGGAPAAGPGPAVEGEWRVLDLGPVVPGDGSYAFALDSASSNSAYYSSREGAHPPELVVATSGSAVPRVDFAAAPPVGPAPLAVRFVDLSAGGPTSWLWSFGDGATSTEQNPSHSYAVPGVYDVTLSASNANGTDAFTRSALVEVSSTVPPVVEFTATPTAGEVPLPVGFTDLSTECPTTQWLWSFGDGTTSTEQNPSHTYAEAGVYDVTLVAANSAGSSTLVRSGYVSVEEGDPTLILGPAADAQLRAVRPDRNYGGEPELRVKASTWRSLLSFEVAGLEGPPARATLRLFVVEGSSNGGALYAVSDAWSEAGVSWNTAPPFDGELIASLGPVGAGTWIEVDVTSAIAGDGSFTLGLAGGSTNLAYYASRESANPPQLVIEKNR